MSQSVRSVGDSLELYQMQLEQINAALSIASDDQKPELLQLQKDLEEIIELTKHSLCEAGSSKEETPGQEEGHLENELSALEGVKCKVPFQYKWGGHGYHDAIILSSEISGEDLISVKVVFMHPTMKKMQPCPYFLEGTCKYSDEKCHFSHGHLVRLDEIRDYSEPDYSSIKEGCTVLAKFKDNLWYKGVVEDVIKEKQFSVKFLHCNNTLLLDFHSIYPIEDEKDGGSDSEDGSVGDAEDDSQFVPHFIGDYKKAADSGKAFGGWEKHTKGIGSRLMAKMGYVLGSGLGREGEGRLEPVQAMVFPPGRSLDRCMELRERAGDGDMLSVEKKLERQKAKAEQRLKQLASAKKDTSIFDLINSKLSKHPDAKADVGGTSRGQPKMADLKQMSHKNLNVQSLQISEEIKRTERDIVKIKQSLQRQRDRGDLASVAQIRIRLAEREKDLERLKASDQHIAKEQCQRKSSSKLTIF